MRAHVCDGWYPDPLHVEERDGQVPHVERPGVDFRVSTDDVGVRVVARVREAPHQRLAENHEAGHLVQQVVHPPGFEGGAVAAPVRTSG